MCAPMVLAAATFALGTAQAVMGYQSQKQQAAAQQQQYDENVKNSRQAAVDSYSSIQNKIIQERKAATDDKTNAAIEGARARATAATAAGESGVSGLSVDALLADYYGREGRYNNSVDDNFSATRNYLVGEMNATRASAQSQMNSVAKPQKPSWADALLRVGTSGLNSLSLYNNLSSSKS